MKEIKIKETGQIEEITVIDAKTGLDWSGDLIGNADPEIEGYDDEDIMIMTQDNFDWWFNYCNEYEKADNAVHEFFQDLTNDCQDNFDTGEPEDAYQRETEMQEKFHDYINGIEFNDIPEYMTRFIEENK